jgi:hypothetical protein
MKFHSKTAVFWMARMAALAIAVCVPLWLMGCGATPPVHVGPIVPAAGQITLPVSQGALKSTVSLNSAVTGGFQINPAVTWSVDSAGGGTIDQTGLYTAPDTAGTYTVRATPVSDPSNPVTITIKVTPKLTVSPTAATVYAGGVLTLTGTAIGTANNAINWTVTEAGGGSVTGATTTGTYTAPTTPGTYHVVATLQADNSIQVSVPIVVQPVPPFVGVTVVISPTSANAIVGDTVHFAASVSNATNHAVTWAAPATATGDFTATTPGDFNITAISVADPSKTSTAVVHVAPRLTVSPTSQPVVFGTTPTIQFTAALGATDVSSSVTWGTSAGSISTSGLLTLPATLANPTGDTIMITATTAGQPPVSAIVTVLPVTTTVAPVRITVNNIPDASNSLLLDVRDASNALVLSQIFPRSKFTGAALKKTDVDFPLLPVRALTVKVTALPGTDASGNIQANNLVNPLDKTSLPTTSVTPVSGSTATATANLQSTINSVAVAAVPNVTSVILGTTVPTLTVTALDSDGNPVVLLPGGITWSSSTGAATVTATGTATPAGAVSMVPVTVTPGTTVITAQETVTTANAANQKKATFSLTVLSNTGDAGGEVRSPKIKGK